MIAVTPLVLTYNEEDNIGRTLAALGWATRIVLIDSFSNDGTLAIAVAAHPNVRVFQRRFDNHTAQWNYGVDQVTTAWVLSLDADYEVTPELAGEIQTLQPGDSVAGYSAGFRFRVFGRPLRATVYPPRTLLFRKDRARYIDDGHTQLLRCDGEVHPLKGLVYHDDRKPLSRWLQSQDRYMLIEAPHLLGKSSRQLKRPDRLRRRGTWGAAVMFVYLLFGKRLIFDGWPGWHYVLQRTLAEALLTLRLITEREGLEAGPPVVAAPKSPSPDNPE